MTKIEKCGIINIESEKGENKMTVSKYLKRAKEALDSGRVTEEIYDSMIQNMELFCDEDEIREGLPSTYAEVEYDDFDNAEAIDGARFDDMNYLRYTER